MLHLDVAPGIQVLGCRVALLHVLDRHLLRETGMDDALRLELLKVLGL